MTEAEELELPPEPQERRTDVDLFAFGSRESPRSPRADVDFHVVDENAELEPGKLPLPMGASAFSDPLGPTVPLSGHYHKLPAGTVIPSCIGVIRDDSQTVLDSPNPDNHYTLYPLERMPYSKFRELFLGLPWVYVEKKKRS